MSVTEVSSAHSISECLLNQKVNGRCCLEDSPAATRQRTFSDPDTSAHTPQASTSILNVDLTSQMAALQQQMQAMQDVVLGLTSSVHSSTPVNQELVETVVPHVEPIMTATSVRRCVSRQRTFQLVSKPFHSMGIQVRFRPWPLGLWSMTS